MYSEKLIQDAIKEGEFTINKEKHLLFKVGEKEGKKFEFVSKKMQYTQREIIIIHDCLAKSDSGKNKKKIEDVILKKLPWRTYESIKNYWKTGSKSTLEMQFKKYTQYCQNHEGPLKPHSDSVNMVRERFVRKYEKGEK